MTQYIDGFSGSTNPHDVDLDDTEYTCGGCDKPQPSKPSESSALELAKIYAEQGFPDFARTYAAIAQAEALTRIANRLESDLSRHLQAAALERLATALEKNNAAAWNIRPGKGA